VGAHVVRASSAGTPAGARALRKEVHPIEMVLLTLLLLIILQENR
jgi:hypothetical protein